MQFEIETKYINIAGDLYIFTKSKKNNPKISQYYLCKMEPYYEYITGMFCVDKKKLKFQGKCRQGKKYIYYVRDDKLLIM